MVCSPTHTLYGGILAYRCELGYGLLCVIAICPDGYRGTRFYSQAQYGKDAFGIDLLTVLDDGNRGGRKRRSLLNE